MLPNNGELYTDIILRPNATTFLMKLKGKKNYYLVFKEKKSIFPLQQTRAPYRAQFEK